MQVKYGDKEYWDSRWDREELPSIIDQEKEHPINKIFLKLHEKFLPKEKLSALEVGGAPGRYIAYLSKHFGYEANIVDYSEIGCRMTEKNFELLGLDINIYNRDFFEDLSDLPRFDVVCSTGFIEHFDDWEDAFLRHVRLLKKGGILIMGVPNYRGVAEKVMARMSPYMLSTLNLESMDLRNWDRLEDECGLTPIFKGYIGGFEPRWLKRCEDRTFIKLAFRYTFKSLAFIWSFFPFLRKYNSPYWSAYLLAIYRLEK